MMPKNYEQSENRGDSRKMQASREGKSKAIDVYASSQRLRDEQKATSQNFIGITSDGHSSTSGAEKALPSRNQASETEQVLRNHLALVGKASTRDLVKRVVDLKKRPNQEENQLRKNRSFTVYRGFTFKELMVKFKMCRSQGASEIPWPSNERRQDRPSLSNSKRDIGSTNQTASNSADWAKQLEEASSAKDAASARIKQLTHEKAALIKALPEQKNEFDRKKNDRELKRLESKIELEKLKNYNALIREKSFKVVSEAAKNIELKK